MKWGKVLVIENINITIHYKVIFADGSGIDVLFNGYSEIYSIYIIILDRFIVMHFSSRLRE